MELDIGAMGTIATGAGTTFVGDIAEALIYNANLSASDKLLVINYLGAKYGLGTVSQSGDHNQDGKVDAADYVYWRKNDSGNVTGYDTWRANFEQPAGSGTDLNSSLNAVPEPATATGTLLLFLPFALLHRTKRAA
jgi:hypothetical protein